MARAWFVFFLTVSSWVTAQNHPWVDSTLNTLTLEEKVGQLFMVPVSAYASAQELAAYEALIKKFKPGSIYITKGSAKSHAQVVNKLQRASTLPLLVGLNAEWGLAQTLDSAFAFPMPLLAGAANSPALMYAMGHEIGKQMRAVGAHINFGPHADADVPLESTVSSRYFGSNKFTVAGLVVAYAEGLQQANVMAVAKHLPGLSPESSSKEAKQYFENLGTDTASFYPFKRLIQKNVSGLLTSHLHFNALQNGKPVPAAVSQIFISDAVKRATGYNGLMFADIPYLTSVVRKGKGDTEKTAFLVGNDVLIAPQSYTKAIKKIVAAAKADPRLLRQLNESTRKILSAKVSSGLHRTRGVTTTNLNSTIFSNEAKRISRQLNERAVTIVQNAQHVLPVMRLENRSFQLITIGTGFQEFETMMQRYVPVSVQAFQSVADTVSVAKTITNQTYIVTIEGDPSPYSAWLNRLSQKTEVVVCHFGNVIHLKSLEKLPTVLAGYDAKNTAATTAELIFGALPAVGKLPVTLSTSWPSGHGSAFPSINRLTYSLPEAVDMTSPKLAAIDSIAQEALRDGATPGMRIMIARKGKVVYNKSFGYQASDKQIPVTEQTIYDLASVTKVTATLQAAMFLYEHGLLDINKKVSVYLPEFKNTNKADIIVKDVLTHQSGLWPYFPWHVGLVKDSAAMRYFFRTSSSTEYPYPVSKDMFAHKTMRDSMWHWIVASKMIEKKNRTPYEYRYSDLSMYTMQRIVEKLLNQPLEDFVLHNFYEPMGSTTTGFLPLQRFPETMIAPTENDQAFRKSLLTGFVHDPGAAMHGGVAGHAGLFSNANDLLKLGQMWLQKGNYGGTQYFQPETIQLFTQRTYATSRRGLGWDKPTGDANGATGVLCSPETFGHTGFTGTSIWIDPKYELVYVFLSNRVNPEINGKLLSSNIRTRIHDAIYEAMTDFEKTLSVNRN
jgi:beta-N-acetylhexosaminidase